MKIERHGAHTPPTYFVDDFDPIADAQELSDALSGFTDDRFRIEDFQLVFRLSVHGEEPGRGLLPAYGATFRRSAKYGFILALDAIARLTKERQEMRVAAERVHKAFAEGGERSASEAAYKASDGPYASLRSAAAFAALWSHKREDF